MDQKIKSCFYFINPINLSFRSFTIFYLRLCPGYHFGVSEKSVVFNRNLNIFASTRLTCLPITIANILQSIRQFQKPIKKSLIHELERFQQLRGLNSGHDEDNKGKVKLVGFFNVR